MIRLKFHSAVACIGFLFLVHPSLHAQTDTVLFPKRIIRFSVARSIVREPHIGFEWRNNFKNSHEIRVGWIYSNEISRRFFEGEIISTLGHFSGPTFSYQHRFWRRRLQPVSDNPNWHRRMQYAIVSATYRYLWYTDKTLSLGGPSGSSDNNEFILSQWRNDLVLKAAFCDWASPEKRIFSEMGAGLIIGWQYTRVTWCKLCDPTLPNAAENTENSKSAIRGADGITLWPFLHFNFQIPIYLKKEERKMFRKKKSEKAPRSGY